jgi:hypothetical protein
MDILLDGIMSAVGALADLLTSVLPVDPLPEYLPDSLGSGVGWLNWFVPFDFLLTLLTLFFVAWSVTLIIRAVLTYFGFLK